MAKYERGKRILHPQDTIENLEVLKKVVAQYEPEKLTTLESTLDELKEMVSRFLPQVPTEVWTVGPDYFNSTCPRCPCCGSRVRRMKDTRCHKCGQLIDWEHYVKPKP